MKKRKPKVYVDMDDTAVNYSKQLAIFKKRYPEYQYPQSNVGFFDTMEAIPGFFKAWGVLGRHYDMRLLTRPSVFNMNSYTEKAVWVRDNMGGIEALERLNLCPDKSIVGEEEDFLVDDWNIHGQEYFKGEFMRFGPNGEYKDWQEVVDYLLEKAGAEKVDLNA